MSMMVSFVLSFFPRDVLDEILNLIESVSEGFPSYSFLNSQTMKPMIELLKRMLENHKPMIEIFKHRLEVQT